MSDKYNRVGVTVPHIEPDGRGGFRLRYSHECELLYVALAREWIVKRNAALRGKEER